MFDMDDGSGSDFGGGVVSLASLCAHIPHANDSVESQSESQTSEETGGGETCSGKEGYNC